MEGNIIYLWMVRPLWKCLTGCNGIMLDASGDPIVASFNFAGIGFANYRNGKPRFVASATQGSLINEQGVPQQVHSQYKI